MYKKVVKFSIKQQKIFSVFVFSFMYLVLVDAIDWSLVDEKRPQYMICIMYIMYSKNENVDKYQMRKFNKLALKVT